MSLRLHDYSLGFAFTLLACQGPERLVDVRDPSKAVAETGGEEVALSEGASGVLVNRALDQVRVEPERNTFALPSFCFDNLSIDGVAVALQKGQNDAVSLGLRDSLVARQPNTTLKIGCDGHFPTGLAKAADGSGRIVSLGIHRHFSLSTNPANVTRIRYRNHAIQAIAGFTATLAAIPASICGIGIAVSNPPAGQPDVNELGRQKAAFTTCTLVTAPIAAVGILVALIDPTLETEFPLRK